MTFDTSPRPISPLRARMIEDMTVRGFKEDTRRDYVRQVRAFAAFIGRSRVTVKKKRRAETALLMLGGCMPIRVWCSWNRRRSSAVAVSGDRPIKAANARTWRT